MYNVLFVSLTYKHLHKRRRMYDLTLLFLTASRLNILCFNWFRYTHTGTKRECVQYGAAVQHSFIYYTHTHTHNTCNYTTAHTHTHARQFYWIHVTVNPFVKCTSEQKEKKKKKKRKNSVKLTSKDWKRREGGTERPEWFRHGAIHMWKLEVRRNVIYFMAYS